MSQNWVVLETLAEPHVDLIKGLLEAQGIPVILSQESAGRAIGLTMGILGRIQILVPANLLERAQEIVTKYYGGEYLDEKLVEQDPEPDNSPDIDA